MKVSVLAHGVVRVVIPLEAQLRMGFAMAPPGGSQIMRGGVGQGMASGGRHVKENSEGWHTLVLAMDAIV